MNYGELLNESLCVKLLTEKWGAFEGQYELAKEIGQVVYDMLMHSKKNIIYYTHHEYIKIVEINVDKSHFYFQPHGNIYGLNSEEGKLMININIPTSYIMQDKEFVLERLIDVVTHELMHGEIFLKKVEHNATRLEDAPSYYPLLMNIMRRQEEDSILYKFARGLYVTYYHESQSMVSQTYNQLINILGDKTYTNSNIKDALKNIEVYDIFNKIIHDLVPFLEGQSDDFLINELIQPLKVYGINFSLNDIKNRIKEMKFIADHTLRDIMRNAMLLKVNENQHKKIKDLKNK